MPKFPIQIWVRRLQRKGEKFFKSKDILTFSLFLLLSFGFWFVNALSSKRQSDLKVAITYIDIPQDVKFTSELPEEIRIKVRDEGVKLFGYNRSKLQTIKIDLSDKLKKSDAKLYIGAQEIENLIASTLLPTTDLINFSPEVIKVDYVQLISQKVPVAIAMKPSPAPQYIFTKEINISPDTIEVFGAKGDIDSIKQVWTEYSPLTGIKKNLSKVVNLQPIENVQLSQEKVALQINVERFTEKNIDIPITFRHVPDSINVRTFPAKINATFNVSMSQFSRTTQNDIALVFDFDDLKGSHANKYKLKIKNKQPNIISNLKITPEEVEFLLESK